MTVKVELPQATESDTEGTIGKWLKQPGDQVAKYDPLVEVETDKVTMEVPAPVDGILGAIFVQEGETVPIGAPICEINTDGEISISESVVESDGSEISAASSEPLPIVAELPTTSTITEIGSPSASGDGRVEGMRLSPVVRRIIEENNLTVDELTGISGSGLSGRLTKQDILGYLDNRPSGIPGTPTEKTAPSPVANQSDTKQVDVIKLTPVRKRIAENMVKASTEIPMAWTMLEVDVNGLMARREEVNSEFKGREGISITPFHFIAKIVVESLREHPLVNSRWDGDQIILNKNINLGVAVAASQGLVVPVVHDADQYSVAGIARAIAGLVARARENKLTVEDVRGVTFTLNNTGSLGLISSRPIINYPQAAILAVEAIVKRPVVVGDAIAIRPIMNLSLTFDHRVMDGQEAGTFLQSMKTKAEAIGSDTAIY